MFYALTQYIPAPFVITFVLFALAYGGYKLLFSKWCDRFFEPKNG